MPAKPCLRGVDSVTELVDVRLHKRLFVTAVRIPASSRLGVRAVFTFSKDAMMTNMAYSLEIAQRIADILAETPGITSKQMFGGICFLLNGNMLLGVEQDRIMVRIGKERYDELLALDEASEMTFTKKPMKGFLYIDETGFQLDADLEAWIDRCIDFVSTLPKK